MVRNLKIKYNIQFFVRVFEASKTIHHVSHHSKNTIIHFIEFERCKRDRNAVSCFKMEQRIGTRAGRTTKQMFFHIDALKKI